MRFNNVKTRENREWLCIVETAKDIYYPTGVGNIPESRKGKWGTIMFIQDFGATPYQVLTEDQKSAWFYKEDWLVSSVEHYKMESGAGNLKVGDAFITEAYGNSIYCGIVSEFCESGLWAGAGFFSYENCKFVKLNEGSAKIDTDVFNDIPDFS